MREILAGVLSIVFLVSFLLGIAIVLGLVVYHTVIFIAAS